jgi:hypothetical protein
MARGKGFDGVQLHGFTESTASRASSWRGEQCRSYLKVLAWWFGGGQRPEMLINERLNHGSQSRFQVWLRLPNWSEMSEIRCSLI